MGIFVFVSLPSFLSFGSKMCAFAFSWILTLDEALVGEK